VAHKRLRERRARSLELGVPATGREQLPLPVVDGPGASGPLAAEDRGGQGVEGGHADAGQGQVPGGVPLAEHGGGDGGELNHANG